MGVVHHSRYLPWFELARTRLCVETGYSYAEIERRGYRLVVTGVEMRYLRGARYGDEVTVECRLTRLASRGLRFEYAVLRDDELLASGASDHVWVQAETSRPCRIPEFLRPGFESVKS
jgi:acyl-CoA thioester hydrolase